MVGKFKKLKEAIKNPPPERLAAIEYRSHAFHMLGVMIVSVILIYKGFWYIIFAFLFSLGVSYSQMMSSYHKYKMIQKFNPYNPPDLKDDPSPTRRRSRIIKEVFGKYPYWLILVSSFAFALFIIDPAQSGFTFKLSYFLLSIFIFVILYYFGMFFIANIVYKKRNKLKGG